MGASESNQNAAPASMESAELGLGSSAAPAAASLPIPLPLPPVPPPPLPLPLPIRPPPPTADAVEILCGELGNLGLNESDTTVGDPAEADPAKQKDSKTGGGHYRHPVRPGEPDCSFYLKTGTCRFGLNCKFNHPPRWKNKDGDDSDDEVENENKIEKENAKSEKLECKGERECPFYMRKGSCKFGTNCRFHHPDPTAPGGSDPHPSTASQTPAVLWSSHGTSTESILYTDVSPYVPMMPFPPVVPPNPGWSSYQAPGVSPLLPTERNMQLPSASVVSNPATKTDSSSRQQKPPVEEFPERPGHSDCQYFLRNGDCKFKSACKFNHPKTGMPKPSTHAVSPMGLPLRPVHQVDCLGHTEYPEL